MSSFNYQSAAGRARLAAGALAIMFLLDLLSVGSAFMTLDLVGQLQGPNPPNEAALLANDTREQNIGLIYLGMFIITVIVFLQWLHRVVANLSPLGGQSSVTPGWAVGYWFVPFINLYRPYTIVKEAWEQSSPPSGPASSARVGVWWALWIIGNLVSNFTIRSNPTTIEEFQSMTVASIIASLLSAGAAAMLVFIVRDLTARQEALHRAGGAANIFS